MLAKEELGKDAIVMNIKTISPKGIFKFFKKSSVEITAAVDEYLDRGYDKKEEIRRSREKARRESFSSFINKADVIPEEDSNQNEVYENSDSSAIERKLNNLQSMLEKQLMEGQEKKTVEQTKVSEENNKNKACVQLIYKQLVANEVDEQFANLVIGEIEPTLKRDSTIDSILASMYQKLVLKLGQTKTLDMVEGRTKYVFFIGPTGVGKTTTIAKLASSIKVEKKGRIALVTSDTYRIAAVEQLRTYATILDIPLKVIYSEIEMDEVVEEFGDYDIVLIDTAGRTHKSKEQRDDIEKLILSIPEEDREVYLVLSATTKYMDLIRITEAYSEISDYRLIFTKLDETNCVGNIFNIKLHTGAPLSYATFGQNVPDDISKIDAQNIAKQLLGGSE